MHTLIEAVILVVLVVYVFLQNLRATLIPTLAVVVSIVGTFVGMTMLGFSINLLTLFGMVLAIGIVVDDAIVVIEAVEANMKTKGLSARDAAFAAMHEVSGPVVAIVLVLAAVFVPTAFLGGTTGVLYKQFAITVVISVILSGFVALTLTPALAALLLDGSHGHPPKILQKFNEWFDRLTERYSAGVRWVLKRSALAVAVFVAFIVAILGLFKAVPGSFVPPEDQGFMLIAAILPDSASLDRSDAVGRRIADIVLEHPATQFASVLTGYSLLDSQYKTNAATVFVSLKDFAERSDEELSLDAVIASIQPQLAGIQDAIVIPLNPPPIPGLGMQGGFELWVQDLTGGEPQRLAQAVQQLVAGARQDPVLAGVNSTFNPASRQLSVKVDREKAETLGAPIADVYGSLQSLFGSLYVSQYNRYGRVWQVVLQAEPEFRSSPEDLRNIFVRGRSGEMVPLDAVTTARFTMGPDLIPRFNGFPAAKINGGAAPGYSSGQAIAAMEQLAGQLPEGYGIAWSGQAYEEKQSGGASALVFVFGLVMVFLILAAQYESWSLPGSVITAVPFGVLGALLAVWLRGMENDVYFQIGLVTLIGLSAEERDPDRRVRGPRARQGPLDRRVGRAGREGTPATDRDDVARLHGRRRPARHRLRRRLGVASLDRHGRDRRHGGRDDARAVLRAAVLRADQPAEREILPVEAGAAHAPRAGGRGARRALNHAPPPVDRSRPARSPPAWATPTAVRTSRYRPSTASRWRSRREPPTRSGGRSSATRRSTAW